MMRDIPIDQVHAGRVQPRRHFDAGALDELTASIREQGQLTPVVVRANVAGWELVCGERRLRACRAAGISTIRAEVRRLDDEAAFLVAVTENIQRNDLTPIEEAEALRMLTTRFGRSQEDAGRLFGKSQEWVAQRLTLLRLPAPIQAQVIARAITPSLAVRLASITDPDRRIALANLAAKGDLRRRDLERELKRLRVQGPSDDQTAEPTPSQEIAGLPAGWIGAVVTGDARELAARLPDASVSLCLCDPVYGNVEDYAWLAEECERVLIPGGSLIAQCGNARRYECECAMRRSGLTFVDLIAEVYPYALGRFFPGKVFIGWKPHLWFSKGPRLSGWVMNRVAVGGKHCAEDAKEIHPWGDSEQFAAGVLGKLCRPGELVWDPFTGSGTVPVVARRLGLPCIAFEVNPETAAAARDRLAGARGETQPQQALELDAS